MLLTFESEQKKFKTHLQAQKKANSQGLNSLAIFTVNYFLIFILF
jgi:hypothetical protein